MANQDQNILSKFFSAVILTIHVFYEELISWKLNEVLLSVKSRVAYFPPLLFFESLPDIH